MVKASTVGEERGERKDWDLCSDQEERVLEKARRAESAWKEFD